MALFDLSAFENDKAEEYERKYERRYEKANNRECEMDRDCKSKPDCHDKRKVKDECLIALKVYDSCRQQDCLTHCEIGSARAAMDTRIGNECIREGDIIDPPSEAASVVIDRLNIDKIIIVGKKPNDFKKGYWDIDVKYVFEYILVFRDAAGCVIKPVKAHSIYDKRVTLFGSVGSDFVIGSDLLCQSDCQTINAEPFVLSEAKAVALEAKLKYHERSSCMGKDFPPEANEVFVTIGLFTIIKLFRIVNLTVESKGFCIPEECQEISKCPCEWFDEMDFPMDIFDPPQKEEFAEGISSNIRKTRKCECR